MTSRQGDYEHDPAIIGRLEDQGIEPGEMWGDTHDEFEDEQRETFIEGSLPRVFVTNSDAPGRGRIFVWGFTRWYERERGNNGAVDFAPISDSEEELRQIVGQTGDDLTEIDDAFATQVRDEFREQSPLPVFPEPSETTYRMG